MLVGKSIPALYNGVSQQPPTMRAATQCEALSNAWPSVVDGLRKRAPLEHVAHLIGVTQAGALIHPINRDVTERYLVAVVNGDLKVFGLDGVEKLVTFPEGKTYLSIVGTATAEDAFSLVTVADYTFVVNHGVTVNMLAAGADTTAQSPNYYWLNRAMSDAALAATGPVKQQYPPNPSQGTLKGTKQTLQDLPTTALVGDIWQIQGTTASAFQTYYVMRGAGVWNETVAPGLRNAIDPKTMPHALVRKADGTFEFSPFSWAPRRVGDETTNPKPTFVGRQINDVFFYKNRLGFLVDENIVMSRAGDFGNYFRMTMLDLLDDDVIDVGASEAKVTKLLYAVPMSGSMMAFADQVQFRVNDGGTLKPTSCSLDAVTQYQMAADVRPVNIGNDVYFGTENATYAAIREYFLRADTKTNDAAEITAHVPRFVPAGLTHMVGSSDYDTLFALSKAAKNRIYVYRYYWTSTSEKAQSAWNVWELDPLDEVVTLTVLDKTLYAVIRRSDSLYLEKAYLDTSALAPGLTHQVYADRRVQLTGVYLPLTDQTEFTLPYNVIELSRRPGLRVIRGASFVGQAGALIDTTGYTWVNETTFRVAGNHSAGPCIVGFAYTFRYTFSQQFITDSRGSPVTTGRLQLRTITLYFTDTAFFRVEVAPYGGAPDVAAVVPSQLADFTGKTVGDAALTLGSPSFASGDYSFQVYGDAEQAVVSVVNDSHLAANFQSAQWEGFYQNRTRIL